MASANNGKHVLFDRPENKGLIKCILEIHFILQESPSIYKRRQRETTMVLNLYKFKLNENLVCMQNIGFGIPCKITFFVNVYFCFQVVGVMIYF